MKCECCHVKEATIHLTQVIDGQAKKLNLCQDCAQQNGIDLNSPISITDVLLGLGGMESPSVQSPAGMEFDLSCSRCQMTRTEFKQRARLGCPGCYSAFMGELNALTKVMHNGTQHIGKIPTRQGSEARITAQIAALQKDIESAVAKEQYETAANLRDTIKTLRSSIHSPENGEQAHDA